MSQFFTFKCRDQNFEDFGPKNYTEDIPSFHTKPLAYVKGGNLLSNSIHSVFKQQQEEDEFKIERYSTLSHNENIDNKLIFELDQPKPALYMVSIDEGGGQMNYKNRPWIRLSQKNTLFVYAPPGNYSLELNNGKNSMMCSSMTEEWFTDMATNLPLLKPIFDAYHSKDYFVQSTPSMFHSEELRNAIDLIHNPSPYPSLAKSSLQINLNSFYIALHDEINNIHAGGYEILIYLLENYREPAKCKIPWLKTHFKVCSETLYSRFKPLFNMSITSFCVMLRLRETLRGKYNNPEGRISEFAMDAGFRNYDSFYKSHIRHLGVPPNYKI